MTAGFSLRKIKNRQTLGQKFKRARRRQKISLLEAELKTKVRGKFLKALEEDNWMNLPADAYTKGFVLRYAKFLKLKEQKIMDLYKKDQQLLRNNSRDLILPKNHQREHKFSITPKLITIVSVMITLIFVSVYVLYQIYGFAAAPKLMVISPQNNSIIGKEEIEVRGITDRDAQVYVNDKEISVSSDGAFLINYRLQKGLNVIEVKSESKAKKEKIVTYTVEYQPKTASIDNTKEQRN